MKDLLKKKWFVLAIIVVLLVLVGAALAVLEVITGKDLLTFWGGPVIGTMVGYIFGRAETIK